MAWYANLYTSNFSMKSVLDILHWLLQIHPPSFSALLRDVETNLHGLCFWLSSINRGHPEKVRGSRKERFGILIHSSRPCP